MRRVRRSVLTLSVLVVFAGHIPGCKELGESITNDIINHTGVIVQKSSQFYVIRSDVPFQNTSEFYPVNLASSFQRDGLRIRFSGNIEDQPGLDYLYVPVRLTSIQAIDP